MTKLVHPDSETCRRMLDTEQASYDRTLDALESAIRRLNKQHDLAEWRWTQRLNRATALEAKLALKNQKPAGNKRT